jgi:hypothetical protein
MVTMVLVNEMVVVAATGGWIGAVGTVGAYAMVSQRRMEAHSLRFQVINVACAALLSVSALSVHNWPSMASNLVWMAIGVHALLGARQALRAAVTNRLRVVRLHGDDQPPPATGPTDDVMLAA